MQSSENPKAWQHVGTAVEGQRFDLDGVDVWSHEWVAIKGESAQVTELCYGQPHTFQVYKLRDHEPSIIFAAGEYSNGVWGFYKLDPRQ